MSYDFYLRSERNCNNNSTVKYLKNFKKIILICIANGWLDRGPFVKYKPQVKEVKRDYLTTDELDNMATKRLVSDRVAQVRDIFVFSCYTGLAYADVKKLKRSEIVTGIDGQKWICTCRQKNGYGLQNSTGLRKTIWATTMIRVTILAGRQLRGSNNVSIVFHFRLVSNQKRQAGDRNQVFKVIDALIRDYKASNK